MQTPLARASVLTFGFALFGLLGAAPQAQAQPPGGPQCNVQIFQDIPYYPGATSCPLVSTGACATILPGSTQCLDVRIPAGVAAHSPTLLFIHGGGWSGGRKDADNDFFERLCQLGYRVVSANYTLACDNAPSFPQAVLDVRAAVGWIKTQGPAYGLSDCIVVVGTSAGGHLAAMVGALASDSAHYFPPGYAGVDLSVRLTITFSGDFDPYRRGCQTTSCPCSLCGGNNDTHLAAFQNDAITQRFVGFTWGVPVPNQYSPFPCPSGVWNYQSMNPGLPTKDPFLNAAPVHWLNPTSSPFYMFHSNCDRFFTTDELDWMIAAATPYGIATKKVVSGCAHGLNIYGQAGSADEVDNAIRNWPLYAHCP